MPTKVRTEKEFIRTAAHRYQELKVILKQLNKEEAELKDLLRSYTKDNGASMADGNIRVVFPDVTLLVKFVQVREYVVAARIDERLEVI